MTKIPFNIMYRPQIESGEYRVVTREDHPVEIKIWDLKGDFPVVGVYYDEKNDRDTAVQVTAKGRCSIHPSEYYGDDFFIVTDEPKLTEFEETLKGIVNGFGGDVMTDEGAKNSGARLFEVARKEIEKNTPRWYKTDLNSFTIAGGMLYYKGYKIDISDLEKLPKED